MDKLLYGFETPRVATNGVYNNIILHSHFAYTQPLLYASISDDSKLYLLKNYSVGNATQYRCNILYLSEE